MCLFDDCAFHEATQLDQFVLGRVQRMRKKGKRGYVEYVQSLSLFERPQDVEVLFLRYSHIDDRTEDIIARPLFPLICKVNLQIDKSTDTYGLQESDVVVIKEFLVALQPLQSWIRAQRAAIQLCKGMMHKGI